MNGSFNDIIKTTFQRKPTMWWILLFLCCLAQGQHCDMYNLERIQGHQLIGRQLGHAGRWGNAISPYWQARTMAALGGYEYVTYGNTGNGWVEYLPKRVPAQPEKIDLVQFNAACAACESEIDWKFPHRCAIAWSTISDQIIIDTQTALASWAKENNRVLPTFEQTDVVIYERCQDDTLLKHPEYGPTAFSFYDQIPLTTQRIFVVCELNVLRRTPGCVAIQSALLARLKQRYPQAEVSVVSGDTFTDFTRLVYAPMLFADVSSFSLVAAMANNGIVWSPSLYPNRIFNNSHWHWSSAPVLYPDVGVKFNLSTKRPIEIIEWLETH